jgi:colanic acid/amylovoran biosynthesis protein
VPAGSDLNRGDQALIWEAWQLLIDSGTVDRVAIIGDDGAAGAGGELPTAQTRARGLDVIPSLLPAPRRGRHHAQDAIEERRLSLLRMGAVAISDFARSAAMLLCARRPRIAGLFMTREQRRSYALLRRASLVVVKGGGFIHAHGGIRAPYYIWFQLFYLRLAHRLGIPVIVLPNSFGPFEGWSVPGQVRRVLNRCRVLLARESVSATALQALLGRGVMVLPDMGYLLRAAPRETGELACRNAGVPLGVRPCVGFTVRPWRFPGSDQPAVRFARYLDAVAALVRHTAARGFHPVLISHVLGPGAHEDDRLALNRLETLLENLPYSRIDHPGDCADLKAIYGCMDYLVGTRFHSVIFAHGAGVPALAIGYGGNKGEGIMRDCGLGEYLVPIEAVSASALCTAFDAMVSNEASIKARMSAWRSRVSAGRQALTTLLAESLPARSSAA